MILPEMKHAHEPPRPVTGITVLFFFPLNKGVSLVHVENRGKVPGLPTHFEVANSAYFMLAKTYDVAC
jgi:hypothetical protein